jgi:hypothetical protein
VSSQAASSRPATALRTAGGTADGYVVLHRPADARAAQALAHPVRAARLHTNICF